MESSTQFYESGFNFEIDTKYLLGASAAILAKQYLPSTYARIINMSFIGALIKDIYLPKILVYVTWSQADPFDQFDSLSFSLSCRVTGLSLQTVNRILESNSDMYQHMSVISNSASVAEVSTMDEPARKAWYKRAIRRTRRLFRSSRTQTPPYKTL